MIAADAQPEACDLHVGVAIAEVPGEPHEFERRARRDLEERLRLPRHQHDPAVVEHDPVAVAQRHRLVEIEQEFQAAFAGELDPPAMPVAGIEDHDVGGAFGLPEARAADAPSRASRSPRGHP